MKITRKKRPDGTIVLRWREPDGRRPQQICADNAEADHFVAKLLLDADSGRLQRRRYRKMTPPGLRSRMADDQRQIHAHAAHAA